MVDQRHDRPDFQQARVQTASGIGKDRNRGPEEAHNADRVLCGARVSVTKRGKGGWTHDDVFELVAFVGVEPAGGGSSVNPRPLSSIHGHTCDSRIVGEPGARLTCPAGTRPACDSCRGNQRRARTGDRGLGGARVSARLQPSARSFNAPVLSPKPSMSEYETRTLSFKTSASPCNPLPHTMATLGVLSSFGRRSRIATSAL